MNSGITSTIIRSLKTINYLLKNNNKVIILSHFGRVKNEDDLKDNSLKIVYEEMKKYLPIVFIDNIFDFDKSILLKNNCVLFENTRYNDIPPKKESINDLELAKYYASFGDVFVFDAFGTSHRIHSSTAGIANFLPVYLAFSSFFMDWMNAMSFLLSSTCSISSGRRDSVSSMALSRRQRSISAWLPFSKTSGTFMPRNSAGRVYCGYSSSPSENDSVSADSLLPNTPGIKRAMQSIATIAASSPPVST